MESLWKHQQEAVPDLVGRKAFGLWWEPGIGKTAALAVAGREAGGRQLWLTLASLRTQTAAEIARFRGDSPRVQIIRTTKDRIDPVADVVVCSYELIRTPLIWKQAFKLRWASLACDEAHRLASPEAATTRAVYGAKPTSKGALIRQADRVWLSTGTPVTNYPDQLWTHVSRLWPELCEDCHTYSLWRERFCQLKRGDFGIQVCGGKDLAELRTRWDRTGSRLTLTDVHDMPALVVDDVQIDLEVRTNPYGALSQEALAELQRCEVEGLEALAPALATERRLVADAKAGAVAAIVAAELEDGLDRAIVFGCHVDALRAVHAALGRFRPELVIGATTSAQRDQAVAKFKLGLCRVLVGNVLALGTGLNLQSCRRVVFLDASWSPAVNRQAIARAFRAGQRRPVQVSFVSAAGTVDEHVQRTLARKATVVAKLEKRSA